MHTHIFPIPSLPPALSLSHLPLITLVLPAILSEWVVYTVWLQSPQPITLYGISVSPCIVGSEGQPSEGLVRYCTNSSPLGNHCRVLQCGLNTHCEELLGGESV